MADNDKIREAFINARKDNGPAIFFSDFKMGWDACMEQAAKSVPQYDPSTAEVPPPGHPLQKLGEYLSLILDEDEWATAEQHLLAAWAGVAIPAAPAVQAVVDRVARAMFAAENATSGFSWEDASPIEIEGWLQIAAAAVAAMSQLQERQP